MNALLEIERSSVAERFNIVESISPRVFTELTSLSRFKLQELIKSGQIRAKRADGRILIEVASVNEYIASLPAETYAENGAQQKEVTVQEAMQSFTDLFT
jgi:hypothetical protein